MSHPSADLHVWDRGEGAPIVLCVHETAATSEAWRPLAHALATRGRVIAYDRPGWGESPAPETYVRTTVAEQAGIAASILEDRGVEATVVCGAGLGAVAALDVVLRRPELARGAVLVEPPLLAFVPEATEALADAAALVREAVAEGGREEALARYQAGTLGVLGAGADRMPASARATGPRAAATLFAELAAVPGWELPLGELATTSRPVAMVAGQDTPPLVRASAKALARAIPGSELRDPGPGLPHTDQAAALADLVIEVAEGRF